MSTSQTVHGVSLRSKFSLLVSLVRRVLWTCVGALVARPLHSAVQPLPIRSHRIPRRLTSRLHDGT
jgi:hypothetical protein